MARSAAAVTSGYLGPFWSICPCALYLPTRELTTRRRSENAREDSDEYRPFRMTQWISIKPEGPHPERPSRSDTSPLIRPRPSREADAGRVRRPGPARERRGTGPPASAGASLESLVSLAGTYHAAVMEQTSSRTFYGCCPATREKYSSKPNTQAVSLSLNPPSPKAGNRVLTGASGNITVISGSDWNPVTAPARLSTQSASAPTGPSAAETAAVTSTFRSFYALKSRVAASGRAAAASGTLSCLARQVGFVCATAYRSAAQTKRSIGSTAGSG
jgi:hypothetical protein